jgi:hypothetical protein
MTKIDVNNFPMTPIGLLAFVLGCSGSPSAGSGSGGAATAGASSHSGGALATGGALNAGGGSSNAAGGSSNAGGTGNAGGQAGSAGSSSGGVGAGGASAIAGSPNASGGQASGGTKSAGTGGSVTGGNGASGGAATGGAKSSGGNPGTGGLPNPGGATASGGNPATGGASNAAGAKASGGASTGGSVGTGGNRASGGANATGGASSGCSAGNYDQTVLCDRPFAYLAMNKASGTEPDLTNNGHSGTHQGGSVPLVALPNGDQASDFNGSSQYVSVASSAAFSIPTTGNLTWEAWIRPDVLQFPHDDGTSGYVDWMGKCEDYSPTCEWEARMYSTNTNESPNRPNRISAYVFNPSAGLGSAADWQPVAGLIQVAQWYHVVGQYTTLSQPSDCSNAATYPGSINIWVNGVMWNHSSHGQTGCMSQYNVVPKANNSPVDIGTMAMDSWFAGAIGKVAFYDYLLTQAQVTNHYQAMTGKLPTGSCGATCTF